MQQPPNMTQGTNMQQGVTMNIGQNMQAGMAQNQATQVLPQPPQVMTTKDMLYMKDMLAWNLLGMKKANALAQSCQDPEVKAALDQAGRMHQRHYQKLLAHMQRHENQQMPLMQ